MNRFTERTTREETESAPTCWECGDTCDELTQAPWRTDLMLVGACCLRDPELEPACSCQMDGGDLFDPRGCEAHDANSPWNTRLRAVTMVQRYEINQEVA
jgi:hypothetical protein